MIRGKISSAIEDLNTLHEKHFWIPNETMIRPSPEMLEKKKRFMFDVLMRYSTAGDYIYSLYFDLKKIWFLEKSLFPYNLPPNVNHDILWNLSYSYFTEIPDEIVNDTIIKELQIKLGSDLFDFAWYKNPKPSVPEFWHVQVFWIPK